MRYLGESYSSYVPYFSIAFSKVVVTMVFSANGEEFVADDNAVGQYSFDYVAIFTSAVSEIAGTTIVIIMVDRLGRIPSQVITYVCGGISMFAFCYLASLGDGSSRSSLMVTSFLARMFFMGGACTVSCFGFLIYHVPFHLFLTTGVTRRLGFRRQRSCPQKSGQPVTPLAMLLHVLEAQLCRTYYTIWDSKLSVLPC